MTTLKKMKDDLKKIMEDELILPQILKVIVVFQFIKDSINFDHICSKSVISVVVFPLPMSDWPAHICTLPAFM